ncbi:opioid growth factor receptor conserved region-domain-containing protein [Rhizoctonia solani]|nr:opioid growth factor receptor conserved region-domain-containing protein [Rhizoctonia solani]
MSRFSSIPHDVKEFLDGYPNNDHINETDRRQLNLKFYSNELKCRPDGLLVEELLDKWQGKYNELERRHGFIQWLQSHMYKAFPNPFTGVNMYANPLTAHEIEEMTASPTIQLRVRRAYELMLDFYGMKLLNTETGLVGRKDHDWEERYQNLIYSSHNNLRITRILKCLSLLSYPHYAAPFVLHVLNEQSEHGLLNAPVLQNSLDRWWANCNRNDQERETVRAVIARIRDKADKRVFTRAAYEQMIDTRGSQGTLTLPD